MSTYFRRQIALPIGIIAAVGIGLLLFIKQDVSKSEARRKRGDDAGAIGFALAIYKSDHDGHLPSSLSELTFERENVDLTPFSYNPNGWSNGTKDGIVVAQAEGHGTVKIRIYSNGEVRWEKPY